MDVLLLGLIAGYAAGGFRTGLVHRLAGLGIVALAFVLGAYARAPIGGLVASIGNVPQAYGELVAYIVIFPVIIAVVNIVAHPLLARVEVGGLTRDADRILGAFFGFAEAVVIISAGIVIFDTYFGRGGPLPAAVGGTLVRSIRDGLASSTTVQILRGTSVPFLVAVLGPLLPKDLSTIVRGAVPGVPGLPSGIPGLPSGIPGLPTPRPSPTR